MSGLKFAQACLALVPALLTPVVVLLLAEGYVDLGGGEKDLLFAIPWFVGSIVFALSAFVLIARGWTLRRWVPRSVLVAVGVLGALLAGAYVTGSLGIA